MDEALPPPAEIAARLYSSVLSDVLDSMGLMAQAMRPFVRPLDEKSRPFRGRPHRPLHAALSCRARPQPL